MRIGIFGGCFNPPHIKHKMIALDLLNKNYLDKVIYVPTGNMYLKENLINIFDRINMLELIFKGNKNIEISSIANNVDYQYTYQVLNYFQKIYPYDEIYFICGTDNLKQFNKWMEYKYILKNYKLLVLKRDNDNIKDILLKFKDYLDNFIVVESDERDISSTMIRQHINNNNFELCGQYLDGCVIDYIKVKKLYKNENVL